MEIRRFVSDLIRSNMYVISEHGHAVIIDPCRNTAVSGDCVVDKILLTHEHYDHISGVELYRETTGAPVLCSSMCAKNILDPRKNMSAYFKSFCELQTWIALETVPDDNPEYRCVADETFAGETAFIWSGHRFELFEIPGHSQGSIGILLDERFFFSGDSLFENLATEVRLPGGSRKDWERISRPRLGLLNTGIRVYPGHMQDFILSEAIHRRYL